MNWEFSFLIILIDIISINEARLDEAVRSIYQAMNLFVLIETDKGEE